MHTTIYGSPDSADKRGAPLTRRYGARLRAASVPVAVGPSAAGTTVTAAIGMFDFK